MFIEARKRPSLNGNVNRALALYCRVYSGKRISSGFTLIEVMIVVAIVAILASIAIPSYNEYVLRGRIVGGITPLSDMQAKMEQYFQDQRTYIGACDPAFPNTVAPKPVNTTYFSFACTGVGQTAYQVDATGLASMNGFAYRLTLAAGVATKTTVGVPSGWTLPATNNCWAIKKDGTCQ